jgi:hypothetical protein
LCPTPIRSFTPTEPAAGELERGRELLNPGGFEPRREAGYCRECRILSTFTEGKCDYCASPAPNTASRDVPAADIDAALRFRVERLS